MAEEEARARPLRPAREEGPGQGRGCRERGWGRTFRRWTGRPPMEPGRRRG